MMLQSSSEIYADNSLRQIQRVNGTYPASVDEFDVTISPPLNDVNKTFAVLHFAYTAQNQHRDTFRAYEIIDSSTLRIYGNDDTPSANLAVDFHGLIFEFSDDSDAFTQHLNFTMDELLPEGEFELALETPVNATTTFLLLSGAASDSSDQSIGVEEFTRVRILNSTHYGLEVGDTPNTGPTRYQLIAVDLNNTDSTVQRGQGQLDGTESQDTITPPTAVNVTNSMLFVTHKTTGDFTQDPDDVSTHATLTASGNVVVSRDDASTNTVEYNWAIVEWEDDLVNVQHFNGTIGDGVFLNNVTIPTTLGNTTNSFVMGTQGAPFGWGNGKSSSTTGGAFDTATARVELLDDSK